MYEISVLIPHDETDEKGNIKSYREDLKQARKACPKLGQIIITNSLGTRYMYQSEKDEKYKLAGLRKEIKVESKKKLEQEIR